MEKIHNLIQGNLLVREPVDDICEQINKSQIKRIVLTGGRGIGKSIVLSALEAKGLETNNKCITMQFEAVGFGSVIDNEQLYIHIYELKFCSQLISYIEKNFCLIYENIFKEYKESIYEYFDEVVEYLNNFTFKEVEIKKYLNTGELSLEILNKIKESLKIENLTLAIDRFDWTHNNNPLVQKILSKYFEMFDKTIITSDDENLQNIDGYSIIIADYSKNIEVVKQIIKKKIEKSNQNKQVDEKFPVGIITDKIYEELIIKTNGNINLMFEIVAEIINIWKWEHNYAEANIKQHFDIYTKHKVKSFDEIKKKSCSKKLYL